MFEIGSSLREARERRNLSYGQVEADTAIRTRYIRALEDEDFHILPGPTYTKGFLRAYAEYLGLDGQPFIDEFNSRHHDPRSAVEQMPITSRPRSRPPRRRHRRESNIVMIALAAIVAVSFLVVLALRFPPQPTADYNTNTGPPATKSGTQSQGTTAATTGTTGTTASQGVGGVQKPFHVVITLSAPTWVVGTIGSPSGPAVIAKNGLNLGAPQGYTVDPATYPTVEFTSRKPVYLGFGAPGNVTLTVNGHRVSLPHVAAGRRVRVDQRGAQTA